MLDVETSQSRCSRLDSCSDRGFRGTFWTEAAVPGAASPRVERLVSGHLERPGRVIEVVEGPLEADGAVAMDISHSCSVVD